MAVMTENKFVPKLRFKEFHDDWVLKILGDTSEIIGGGTPDTTIKDYWGGNIQWFSPSELKEKYISKSKRTISDLGLKNSSAKILPKGTLLFSSRATVGEVAISLNECSTNQGFQSFVVNSLNNTEFLYNWIIENKNQFIRRSSGSTFLEISKKEIVKIKIRLPSLPEQQKIASFLRSVDKKLQQLTKKKELLEEYKNGVMQKIFSQELRFKDEFGNNYPDWEEKRLNEVFHSKRGSGLSGKNIVSDGKNKCILYGALYTKYGEVIDEVIESTNEDGKVKSRIGDILVPASTTTTGIDLANFTALNQKEILLGGDITILRFINKGSNIFWAYYLTHYKKYEVAAFAQGSTIVHIYFSHFGKIQIEEPSIKEQQKIANFLSLLDKKMALVTTQIENTKAFKKGLLQQMFV